VCPPFLQEILIDKLQEIPMDKQEHKSQLGFIRAMARELVVAGRSTDEALEIAKDFVQKTWNNSHDNNNSQNYR